MSVFVDNARNPFVPPRGRRMIMCHMLADTEAELHAMAAAIGARREWFQGDHYDLSVSRKDDAIRRGAIEITMREAVRVRRRLRHARAESEIRTQALAGGAGTERARRPRRVRIPHTGAVVAK